MSPASSRPPLGYSASPTARELEAARDSSRNGDWKRVLEILERYSTVTQDDGQLALLVGEALLRTGRERFALEWLQSSERALRARDRHAHRHLLNLLGAAQFALGELAAAAASFDEARELALRDDDLLLLARSTNNLGALANLRGDPTAAIAHYHLALPAYQRVGQPRGMAEAYHNLAIAYRDAGNLDEAEEHEQRAIEHAGDARALRLCAMGRVGRAEIALRRGDAALAETTARIARDEFARLGDPQNEADASRLVGAACAAQRHSTEALEAFGRALEIARERGHALNEAETLRDRAEFRLSQGDVSSAISDAQVAIFIFDRLGATRERDALRERISDRGAGEQPH